MSPIPGLRALWAHHEMNQALATIKRAQRPSARNDQTRATIKRTQRQILVGFARLQGMLSRETDEDLYKDAHGAGKDARVGASEGERLSEGQTRPGQGAHAPSEGEYARTGEHA